MVTVESALQDMMREAQKARCPKWCKRCGRKHMRTEPCELVEVERIAKSGRKVTRLTHVSQVKES